MAFLNSSQPLVTCVAADCEGCPVHGKIHCHFRPQDLIHFLLICLPGLVIGGAGVLAFGVWHLVLWIATMAGFFAFAEIRALCSHCPHYAEAGKVLGCWANHGAPKLWKYRPGPMSLIEKLIFFAGLAVIWGYPLPALFMGGMWFLLMLYILTNAGFFMTLRMFLCARCMNFACPLNAVESDVRKLFFQRNPSLAKCWEAPH